MKKVLLLLTILTAFNISYATMDCVRYGISGFCGSDGFFQSNAKALLNLSEDESLSIEERIRNYQALIRQINNDLKYLDDLVGHGGFDKRKPVTASASPSYSSGGNCQKISNRLWIGKTDATTDGDVTRLQQCLVELGFLNSEVTGFYGKATQQAVYDMQRSFLGFDFVNLTSGFGIKTRESLKKEYQVLLDKKLSCKTVGGQSGEFAPVITSLSSYPVTTGESINIRGCNFYGFESDRIIRIVNSAGEEGTYTLGSPNVSFSIKVPKSLCKQDNSYSGLPCSEYLSLVPGKYKMYAVSYGGKSNIVELEIK
jgi:hypothetical protein